MYSGLAMWLDAGSITGLNDGDPLSAWTDLSGLGYHATQSTAAAKPTYRTNALNGLPALDFDGVDDNLAHTLEILAAPMTAFVVAKRTAGGSVGYQGLVATKSHSILAKQVSTELWGTYMTNFVSSGQSILNSFSVLSSVIRTHADLDLSTNGSLVTRTNGTAFYTGGLSRIGYTGLGGEFFKGQIAEVLVYAGVAFSETPRRTVERYLSRKWGVALTA